MTDLAFSGSSVELVEATKRFQGSLAVDRVSLSIAAGESVVLLGPSGCGKTTTLRLIAGLESADDGRVLIDGHDMTRTPVYKRNLGMVFQNYALFPHLSVGENVAFGMRLRRTPKGRQSARVRELLRLVGLGGYDERQPHQLSGGEQQRVGLARALAVEPKVLLMDEPFGALDRKLRQELQREFRELQRRLEVTTIFVTHDQEEALLLANRVAVMNAGTVEQVAAPSVLYNRPRTKFVASFLGEANLIDGEVRGSSTGTPIVSAQGLEIALASGESVNDGPSSVMIRPEFVQVELGGSGLPGTVTAALYLGERIRYEVRLDSGHDFVASTPAGGQTPIAEGERVTIGWPPTAARPVEG